MKGPSSEDYIAFCVLSFVTFEMDMLGFFLVVVSSITCAYASVKIVDLNVHNSVQLGTADEIVMDCNFEATSNESAVLKWFYNGDVEQIYQWILETKGPGNPMGRLKHRLNLEHTITDQSLDLYKAALKIKNVTADLTGNYTCKISGDYNEDSETKQLVIYSPAKSDLEVLMFKHESLVICTVNGIYPMPKIDFYIISGNNTRDISEDISSEIDDDGFFNVTARHEFDNTTLLIPMLFVCNLTIPGTDYTLSKTLVHQIEDYDNLTELEEETQLLNTTDYEYTTEGNFNLTELPENAAVVHLPSALGSTALLIVLLAICN